jgi:hypothetical protein
MHKGRTLDYRLVTDIETPHDAGVMTTLLARSVRSTVNRGWRCEPAAESAVTNQDEASEISARAVASVLQGTADELVDYSYGFVPADTARAFRYGNGQFRSKGRPQTVRCVWLRRIQNREVRSTDFQFPGR